jgi:hypothetical protein
MTEAELDALVDAFLARTLPAAQWTHEAHLLVGMILARRLTQAELLPALRQAISAYNLATGGRNTETSGYHESITAFYASVLGPYARATADLAPAEAAARLLAGPLARRDVLLRAYAPETLGTIEARLGFRPPDQAGFDPDHLVAEALDHG